MLGEESPYSDLSRGRPRAIIDWAKVERFARAGCSGIQIASILRIDENTLYRRCLEDKGIVFSHYCQSFSEHGIAEILDKQLEVALKGSETMLLWLGKCRAKQKPAENENNNTGNPITIGVYPNGVADNAPIPSSSIPTPNNTSAE